MNLRGRRIHIVGSADPEADEKKLSYVHSLVSELTVTLAREGATFVIPFGKEEPDVRGACKAVTKGERSREDNP